ncbi:MAG: Mrp/NBP35 family ATP-binding protein [Bifidobacteriaceae bacterium]|nr:Mrp/NBP35 family ATP-binding protein [Bifidobacteriaceae bacterium]
MPKLTEAQVRAALATVIDPEIRRPITDLDMVNSVELGPAGAVTVEILLTVAGCPMKDQLESDVKRALATLAGIGLVTVKLGVMDQAQRQALMDKLRGGPAKSVPFSEPSSRTRVIAVASGKGGVGKSSVTANLAVAFAQAGLAVGVLDADIQGFSMPRMLGVEADPTQVDDAVLPPLAHGIKVFSMGMLVPPGQPVVWRGPVLHRAVSQFLTDVIWGDLDVLLVDLPPGTGDVPLSVAQLIPGSGLIVVTTPQPAAAEVAQRAGALALQTKQPILGVIENMSWLDTPSGERLTIFGQGGGALVAANLAEASGTAVPLLGQLPLDQAIREGGDSGEPVVLAAPDHPAAREFKHIAAQLLDSGPS